MESTSDDKEIAAALMRLEAVMELRDLAVGNISRWKYLGGEEKGFVNAYEVLVEDLSFDEMRGDQKEHFGFSDRQAESLKAVSLAIKALVERLGYRWDNRVYIGDSEWPTIVSLARRAFIDLQRCR